MIDLFNFSDKKIPYVGGERAARPYRDWYILVSISLICLVAMIAGYGYLVIGLNNHEALSSDTLIERSLLKIKPQELEAIALEIARQEAYFLQLMATSSVAADPSH